jgi:hypothetical protein
MRFAGDSSPAPFAEPEHVEAASCFRDTPQSLADFLPFVRRTLREPSSSRSTSAARASTAILLPFVPPIVNVDRACKDFGEAGSWAGDGLSNALTDMRRAAVELVL